MKSAGVDRSILTEDVELTQNTRCGHSKGGDHVSHDGIEVGIDEGQTDGVEHCRNTDVEDRLLKEDPTESSRTMHPSQSIG